MSASTSVLIYKIGHMITGKRAIGFIAGLINATSLTAASLAVSFLSETLFVFLLSLATYVFLRVAGCPNRRGFILLGLIIAYAVFTRSVGIFLPFVFVIAVAITPQSLLPHVKKRKLLGYSTAAAALALILISSWGVRNYFKHEMFSIAGTGPGAAAMYLGTRVAADRSDSLTVLDYRDIFKEEFVASVARPLTYRATNEWYVSKFTSLFREDPISFTVTFLKIVKENMFAPDQMTRLRMPVGQHRIRQYIQLSLHYKLYLAIAFSTLAGAGILLYKRKTLGAILLGLCYLGFAATSGFTYWQGSRICYPTQVAWSIFVAVGIYYPLVSLASLIRSKVLPGCDMIIGYARRASRGLIWIPNDHLGLSVKTYKRILVLMSIVTVATFHVIFIIPLLRPTVYTFIDGVAGHSFGKSIEVTAIKLGEKAGSSTEIEFDFRSLARLSESYRVFLHFFPADKKEMINRDFKLSMPTTNWQEGMLFSERVALDLNPGAYSVRMGFFNSQGWLDEPLSFQITIR